MANQNFPYKKSRLLCNYRVIYLQDIKNNSSLQNFRSMVSTKGLLSEKQSLLQKIHLIKDDINLQINKKLNRKKYKQEINKQTNNYQSLINDNKEVISQLRRQHSNLQKRAERQEIQLLDQQSERIKVKRKIAIIKLQIKQLSKKQVQVSKLFHEIKKQVVPTQKLSVQKQIHWYQNKIKKLHHSLYQSENSIQQFGQKLRYQSEVYNLIDVQEANQQQNQFELSQQLNKVKTQVEKARRLVQRKQIQFKGNYVNSLMQIQRRVKSIRHLGDLLQQLNYRNQQLQIQIYRSKQDLIKQQMAFKVPIMKKENRFLIRQKRGLSLPYIHNNF